MTYELEASKQLLKKFDKVRKKDSVQAEILKRKINEILENPNIGEPLTGDMAGQRSVHVRHFVLTYEVLENQKIVRLLDYEHYDNIYKR